MAITGTRPIDDGKKEKGVRKAPLKNQEKVDLVMGFLSDFSEEHQRIIREALDKVFPASGTKAPSKELFFRIWGKNPDMSLKPTPESIGLLTDYREAITESKIKEWEKRIKYTKGDTAIVILHPRNRVTGESAWYELKEYHKAKPANDEPDYGLKV